MVHANLYACELSGCHSVAWSPPTVGPHNLVLTLNFSTSEAFPLPPVCSSQNVHCHMTCRMKCTLRRLSFLPQYCFPTNVPLEDGKLALMGLSEKTCWNAHLYAICTLPSPYHVTPHLLWSSIATVMCMRHIHATVIHSVGILGSRRAILGSSSCKITWHNVGSITFKLGIQLQRARYPCWWEVVMRKARPPHTHGTGTQ